MNKLNRELNIKEFKSKNIDLFLYVTESTLFEKAIELTNYTNAIKLVKEIPQTEQIYLMLDKIGLSIVDRKFKPLYVSEIYIKLVRRVQNLKNELIIQAFNLVHGSTIWDLTAGFGKDACILASNGYIVTMVEQNPILATIVYYALKNNILPSKNLNLVYSNSVEFIKINTDNPDGIYLDPMFSDDNTAKAKKEMQIIQNLTSICVTKDDEELFISSLNKVKNKLIVKRDDKQPNLVENIKPTYIKNGKTIRYDVYLK